MPEAVNWAFEPGSLRQTVHAIQDVTYVPPYVPGLGLSGRYEHLTLCGLTLGDAESHAPDPELPLCRSCLRLVPDDEQWKARRRLLRSVPDAAVKTEGSR